MTPTASLARVLRVSLLALGCLALAFALALTLGVEHCDLRRAFLDPSSHDAAYLTLRFERALLAGLVGMALAPAGLGFQALLRNPLADPYVLGVSGGAAVAGTIVILFGGGLSSFFGPWLLPICAFLGALGAIALVSALGRVRGRLIPVVALLAGVVVNALASAIIVALRLFATPDAAHDALYWLTGTIQPVRGTALALAVYVAFGVGFLYTQALGMNAFALGDEAAHTVGIDVERTRRRVFLAGSLLTGAAVAFAGPIGFVGIIVPHILRALLGPDHRVLVPASALVGAALLVLAETAARLSFLVSGQALPVGVLTALLGVPFFLLLLAGRGRRSFW
jgi:iron complex transport system permease protein